MATSLSGIKRELDNPIPAMVALPSIELYATQYQWAWRGGEKGYCFHALFALGTFCWPRQTLVLICRVLLGFLRS